MRKIIVVAWREFRHTAMTKAFLFGAVVMPLLMMGLFIFIIPLLASEEEPLSGKVVVLAPEDVVAELQTQISDTSSPISEALEQIPSAIGNDPLVGALLPQHAPNEIEMVHALNSDIVTLKESVREGEYVALIVVPESVVNAIQTDDQLEVYIPNSFTPNHTDLLTSTTSKSVVNIRLRRLGHDPEQIHELVRRPKTYATRLSEDGTEAKDNEIARKLIPMAFMLLLWIATFTSGNYLLTTTIEEKGNKVMEVLLSAVSPMQLLAGKILGQAGVSAVILCMYGSAAMAGLVAFAMLDLVPISHLLLFSTYFIIAYFMVATIMAAAGSAVSELSDAQSLMGPVMLIMIVPFALWPIITEHPNGMVAVISGLTPPLLPFIMIIRVTASTELIATWQIVLSICIGLLSVIAMIWMCGRIFRIGILMQGKPPSILQLAKWIRRG